MPYGLFRFRINSESSLLVGFFDRGSVHRRLDLHQGFSTRGPPMYFVWPAYMYYKNFVILYDEK
jgi:hypothetical protein